MSGLWDTRKMSSDVAPREAPTEGGLSEQLSSAILQWIGADGLAAGTRLTERDLAQKFKVSRSPIRRALQSLHQAGYVSRTDTGRYVVAASGSQLPSTTADPVSGVEELYLRIAEDRLDGKLAERISESALARRYDLTRAQVSQILRRISNEGWAAPLPGHGWEFLPVLTSLRSYQDSYRFRLLVEPAAILEPTFQLDRLELLQRRDEQQALVDGGIYAVTAAELFELNTRLHGTIARCSGNSFIVDSLDRINRLRRLIEYRQALVPERAVVRCAEHVELADLLLAGRRTEASNFLRKHLTTVSTEKAQDDAGEPADAHDP